MNDYRFCRFCGENESELMLAGCNIRIHCPDCGASTPPLASESEAICFWRDRKGAYIDRNLPIGG